MPMPPVDASTIVSRADYQRITGDQTTATTTIDAALNEALALIQEEIGRVLAHGTYTETLKVYRNNTVYPSATPIASVSSPNVDLISIQGAGIYLGYYNPTPIVNYGDFNSGIPPQATITYVGGYTQETLPAKLRRAICRTAYNSLHPAPLAGVPSGVGSVRVGDVGYSAAGGQSLRTLDPLDDGVRRDISRFRNANFLGWQIDVTVAP